jgi:hypothetical protein
MLLTDRMVRTYRMVSTDTMGTATTDIAAIGGHPLRGKS